MDKLCTIFKRLGIISGVIGLISLIPCPETILALVLPFPSAINKMTIWPLVFLFMFTPLFVILTTILSFRERKMAGRFFSVVLILILIFPIVTVGSMFLRRYQPQTLIFKPTVINQENLPIYKECIQYAKEHNDDKNLTFHNGYRVIVGGKFYMLSGNHVEVERVKNIFSEQQISEMKGLCSKLYSIGCARFQRYNDFLIFYKTAYTSRVNGSGVLYSLGGVNPNEVSYDILNECKPFVKIAGNWYASRNLMLKGPRSNVQCSLGKGVFEDSLKIDEDIRQIIENE